MANRNFSLPGINRLIKEQENVRALPKQGQYLIVGGPGTGKSVVALLRSKRHHENKEDYIFLVYNRLLDKASRHLFGTTLTSVTWNSWFNEIFRKMTNKSLPLLPPNENGWQDIDWEPALVIIKNSDTNQIQNKHMHLIIDEGQDMPPGFYEALVNLGFENFYVVADQNQKIKPNQNSSREDIENSLGLDSEKDTYELKYNHRNSYAIARLAREFYTGDPASPPPDLPPIPKGINILPRLVEYGNNSQYTFMHIITAILKTADKDPRKLVGVITPKNIIRTKYVNELSRANPTLDNGKPRIRTYATRHNPDLSFDEGGIIVINAQSCKGLEFDTVILADIDQYYCNANIQDEIKRLFYVMVARARDYVVLIKNGDRHCPVDNLIPKNTDILERRR